MLFKDYTEELDLISNQNNTEYDFYNIIAPLLKECSALSNYSIRDVSQRKRTTSGLERIFWGLGGFPDFVILDKAYNASTENNKDAIHGVVEAKYIGKALLDRLDDKLQLVGHLLSFKFVIYTNGYVWRIYSNSWTIDSKELLQKENESYYDTRDSNDKKKAKKARMTIRKIRDWLAKFSLDNVVYEEYILKDEDRWNKDGWDKLIRKLSELEI